MCFSILGKYFRSLIILIFIIVVMFIGNQVSAETSSLITATKENVTAINVPQNSSLIVTLYENERLLKSNTYLGHGDTVIITDFSIDKLI